MSPIRGFTLAEILVALVVFQVGVLGAGGMLVLAGSVLSRGRDLEWAVQEVRSVADSLGRFGTTGAGARETAFGRVEWDGSSGSLFTEVRIQAWRHGEADPFVDVAARVPVGAGGGP